MSIVVGTETKLCVSGITGREGTFHAMNNRRYGTDVVAGVTPVLGLVTFLFQHFSTTADHYLYVSMLGPALAAAWAVAEQLEIALQVDLRSDAARDRALGKRASEPSFGDIVRRGHTAGAHRGRRSRHSHSRPFFGRGMMPLSQRLCKAEAAGSGSAFRKPPSEPRTERGFASGTPGWRTEGT